MLKLKNKKTKAPTRKWAGKILFTQEDAAARKKRSVTAIRE